MNLESKKNLDICIPTYNRAIECIRQIDSLIGELHSSKLYKEISINIIIRDNHSDKEQYEKIINEIPHFRQQFLELGVSFTINRNNNNIGLVGNLIEILNVDSSGDYVWFVGDDDILHPGFLDKIIPLLRYELALIFMNYNCVHKEYGIVKSQAFDRKESEDLLSLFRQNDAIMMFITSCIYNREVLIASLIHHDAMKFKQEITLPLYWAFYAESVGVVNYIDSVIISDVVSGISWGNVYNKVRLSYVPREICKLRSIGYTQVDVVITLLNYYLKNYRFLIGVLLRVFIPNHIVDKTSKLMKRKK